MKKNVFKIATFVLLCVSMVACGGNKSQSNAIEEVDNMQITEETPDKSGDYFGYIPQMLAEYYNEHHDTYKSVGNDEYMRAEEAIQEIIAESCGDIVGHKIPVKGEPYNTKFINAVIVDVSVHWSTVTVKFMMEYGEGDSPETFEKKKWINSVYALFKTSKGEVVYADLVFNNDLKTTLTAKLKGDPHKGISPLIWEDVEYIELFEREEGIKLYNIWLKKMADAVEAERRR